MATLEDVARAAGVSTGTASRALSGRKHVHPCTRARVQQAVRELNYEPSRVAQALATGRGIKQIGLVLQEFG